MGAFFILNVTKIKITYKKIQKSIETLKFICYNYQIKEYDYEITTRFCDLAGRPRICIKRDEVEKFILNYLAKKFPEYKKDYINNIMKTKFNEEYDLNV